jgi:hypothetical protein
MQQDTIRDLLRSTQGDAENAQLKEQLASVMSENSSLQCKLDEATKSVRSYTEIVTEHYELSASLEHKVAELTEEVCVAASPFILAIVDLSLCMVHGAWCMVHGAWCMVHGVCTSVVLSLDSWNVLQVLPNVHRTITKSALALFARMMRK